MQLLVAAELRFGKAAVGPHGVQVGLGGAQPCLGRLKAVLCLLAGARIQRRNRTWFQSKQGLVGFHGVTDLERDALQEAGDRCRDMPGVAQPGAALFSYRFGKAPRGDGSRGDGHGRRP